MAIHSHDLDPEVYARRWKMLAGLLLSLVIIGLDNTVLNVALPSLQEHFDASTSTLQWIVDAYMLAFAGLLLTMGALGDRFGRKHALQAGLALAAARTRPLPAMSSLSVAAERPAAALSTGGTLVLALGALDFGLEQTIVLPALPRLAQDYGAAIAVPLCGRLGDLLGKKRMLLVCLGAVTIGSLVCALSTTIGLAIAGRAVQGLGAAVSPLTLALSRATACPRHSSRGWWAAWSARRTSAAASASSRAACSWTPSRRSPSSGSSASRPPR
jgi:MFS family permease